MKGRVCGWKSKNQEGIEFDDLQDYKFQEKAVDEAMLVLSLSLS